MTKYSSVEMACLQSSVWWAGYKTLANNDGIIDLHDEASSVSNSSRNTIYECIQHRHFIHPHNTPGFLLPLPNFYLKYFRTSKENMAKFLFSLFCFTKIRAIKIKGNATTYNKQWDRFRNYIMDEFLHAKVTCLKADFAFSMHWS